MNIRLKLAFSCHLVTAILLALFGFAYFFKPEFMPYHEVAVGQRWSEVAPAHQILILALMKATGGGLLTTAIAMILLLLIPFRNDARWSYWAVPIIGLTSTISSLYVMLFVSQNTPASPPWVAPAFGTVLLTIGLITSIIPYRTHSQIEDGECRLT